MITNAPAGVETPGVFISLTPTAEITETLAVSTSTPLHTPTPIPATAIPWGDRDVIGISVEGRPLEIFRFGEGDDQRMIVAGIHGGNEWNTSALADELMAYLLEHPDTIPKDLTLFILRNLNPDGEARAHGPDGRVNARGVDLNRNFPVNWQENYRRSGCWQERPVTAGTAPASEPETQALMSFITAQPGINALISYHSAALGIFPGGSPPDPESINLAESLATVSGYKYPPMDTGCIYTGQLVDWVSAQGIAAVDIELTNHRDTDFEINLKVLKAFLKWEAPETIPDEASGIQ